MITKTARRVGDSTVGRTVVRALDRLSDWDDAVRSRWPFRALAGPNLRADEVSGDGSRLLVRPAILGFVAITAISIGSVQQRSPFALKLPGAWFFGVPAAGSEGSSHGLFFGLVAVYGGLLLLMRVWYGLARSLSQVPGVPVRKLAVVAGIWMVPLLIAPPLFSRDVYSYAAQGEMMSHHISPYVYGPGVLGAGPYVSLVDKLWINAPAPYGPLFLKIDGALTSLSGHRVLPDVVLLRLLALFGVGLIAFSIPKLARTLGRDPSEAFVLAVLNPVTLLHLVGGAHNDALMVGLLVSGITAARVKRPVLGIVLCSLAAAVKVPAALGVVYIAWDWMGPAVPIRDRVRPMVSAALVASAIMGALSFVTGLGWGWIENLASPGTVRSWVAPATGIGMLLTDIAHAVDIGVPQHAVLSFTRLLGVAVAGGVGLWLLVRSERFGALRALGVSLLVIVLLGPVVQPWYLSWGLVLLAPVATGKVRSLIITLSIGSAFLGLPGGHELVHDLLSSNPLAVAAALVVLLAILTVPLTSSERRTNIDDAWHPDAADGPSGGEPSFGFDHAGA
ncbi:MAG TPA: polyprenol phosphomannose-dependent alpha 1,6 mannosyltransferase MptB [Acidimicrobiales bacterium]|nr:polyprenol phosphomannose-dependent alpha 1,6 mannosyltransferase MptB [Acidimicrobiales bacterium]